MMKSEKGFSLVELLVGVGILLILVTIMTGAFNPAALIVKANDARRKKDLGRIRVSFEDYYNDKGCYPNKATIDQLNLDENCGSDIFSPWMSSWPCDPESRQSYIVISQDSQCPEWFKIYATLGNLNDPDIPDDWYNQDIYFKFADGQLTTEDANYGTSSTNVNWYEYEMWSGCEDSCFTGTATNCTYVNTPAGWVCSGARCYLHHNCDVRCQVPRCD